MAKPQDMPETGDLSREELDRRRAAARRTAWILAAVAAAIFVTFLVTGISGRG